MKGDTATAWSRWTFIVPAADGKPVISQAGRYDDTLVRENGRWRFKRRTASNDIPAPQVGVGYFRISHSPRYCSGLDVMPGKAKSKNSCRDCMAFSFPEAVFLSRIVVV